jgi:hypothetical protein
VHLSATIVLCWARLARPVSAVQNGGDGQPLWLGRPKLREPFDEIG